MNQDGFDADDLRRAQHALNGVSEERPADPLPLISAIDGQMPQHHDRDRVRHVALHPLGSFGAVDRPGRQAVVGDDIAMAEHLRARATARVVLQRSENEPVIEVEVSAIEAREIVRAGQPSGGSEIGRRHSHGAGVRSSLRSASVGSRGVSSIVLN